MKNSMQHLLRSKGASKKALFPLFLGGRGPKKHACFLEGAAWSFSWLTPFCLHLAEPWNAGSFRICPSLQLPLSVRTGKFPSPLHENDDFNKASSSRKCMQSSVQSTWNNSNSACTVASRFWRDACAQVSQLVSLLLRMCAFQ